MTDIRWKQRFQNFKKAFLRLQEIVESKDNLSEFESIVQEGIIQRFEYTFELAWKTLKDRMEFDGSYLWFHETSGNIKKYKRNILSWDTEALYWFST